MFYDILKCRLTIRFSRLNSCYAKRIFCENLISGKRDFLYRKSDDGFISLPIENCGDLYICLRVLRLFSTQILHFVAGQINVWFSISSYGFLLHFYVNLRLVEAQKRKFPSYFNHGKRSKQCQLLPIKYSTLPAKRPSATVATR